MRVNLKKFLDDLCIMYPDMKDNKIFKAWYPVTGTRAVAEIGVEVQMLQKDYDEYIKGFKKDVAPKVDVAKASAMLKK